jgi:CNT family concentrative nucleoside transporter
MINIFAIYPAVSCIIGALLTLLIAYAVSFDRSEINYKNLFFILCFETILAFGLLKTNIGQILLAQIIRLTKTIGTSAHEGIVFLFGALGSQVEPWGFIFAFHVLPIIIFFSALVAVLSYLGIIDFCIRSISYVLRPLLGTSSAETACAVAKSFLGPTEAQLVIRDYLAVMSESELFAVMVSSLSMMSASLFAVYMEMGVPGSHLIAANFMGIPGSLLFAKIIMPSQKKSHDLKVKTSVQPQKASNLIEAIIQGTMDGLQLVLAIGALLLSFLALIAMLNMAFVAIGSFFGITNFTFQDLVGYLFSPFGFLMGVPTQEAINISELIGIKFLANEMVAFAEISGKHLSERGLALATYAICGFANIACVGIVIGGISTLAPDRRSELSALAWYSLLAATLSNLFSAYFVGIIL